VELAREHRSLCLQRFVTCELAQHPVNDGLILRALGYFDDAEAEAALPGEGADDWDTVKCFFRKAVAALIVPPTTPLTIQSHSVDVRADDA